MKASSFFVAKPALVLAALAVLAVGCDEDKKKAELLAKVDAAVAPEPVVTAASATATAAPPTLKPIVCPPGNELPIVDPDLESDVRKKLNKQQGALSVGDFASVKSLNLTSKESLDELDPCLLPKMKGLKHLYLGPGKLHDLRPIATLTQLETLRASINEVEDLKPLENLVLLDALDLGRTHVRDITALGNLVNLTDLQLDGTQVSDIGPLAKCKKLEKLSIKHTNVIDVSPLRELTKLKWLYIEGAAIANLDTLQPLVARGLRIVTK